MTEAERALGEVAKRVHQRSIGHIELRELTAPYLPKPEPDRLTVAARECLAVFYSTGELTVNIMGGKYDKESEIPAIRAIIARALIEGSKP